jgi:dsDNA-specific endonuclease/ATPase MutS2
VIGGPDVWEVIAAARSAPERGEKLIQALAQRIGVPVDKIQVAISYYGEYPDEVNQFIAANEQEADQLERALENERRLLE